MDSISTPIRLSTALDKDVTDVSKQLEFSKQETMRLAIRRGLPVLLKAFGKKPIQKTKKARAHTGAAVPA